MSRNSETLTLHEAQKIILPCTQKFVSKQLAVIQQKNAKLRKPTGGEKLTDSQEYLNSIQAELENLEKKEFDFSNYLTRAKYSPNGYCKTVHVGNGVTLENLKTGEVKDFFVDSISVGCKKIISLSSPFGIKLFAKKIGDTVDDHKIVNILPYVEGKFIIKR